MTDEQRYAVLLVPSLAHALKAEKLLEQQAIPNKLIPVPRHLSSQCGVCVRILRDNRDRVVHLLNNAQLEMTGVHEI
jgi:hypothetical protein